MNPVDLPPVRLNELEYQPLFPEAAENDPVRGGFEPLRFALNALDSCGFFSFCGFCGSPLRTGG